MNFQKRKQIILDKLNDNGEVDMKQIAAELGISEITIRRDLNQLASRRIALPHPRRGHESKPARDTPSSLLIRPPRM